MQKPHHMVSLSVLLHDITAEPGGHVTPPTLVQSKRLHLSPSNGNMFTSALRSNVHSETRHDTAELLLRNHGNVFQSYSSCMK
jgi:hypothetical protein